MSKSAHSTTHAASEPEFVTNWSSLVAAFVLLAVGAAVIFVGLVFFGPAQSNQPEGVVAEAISRSIVSSEPRVSQQEDEVSRGSLNQVTSAQPADQPAITSSTEELVATVDSSSEVENDPEIDELVDDSAVEESLLAELPESPTVPNPITDAEPLVELPNNLPSRLDNLDDGQLVAALGFQAVRLDVVSVETNKSGIVDAVFSENFTQAASQGQEALAGLNQPNDLPGASLAERRSGIAGIPFRKGDDCRLDEHAARNLGEASRRLNALKSVLSRSRQQVNEYEKLLRKSNASSESLGSRMRRYREQLVETERKFLKGLDEEDRWHVEEAVPALEQVLQAESSSVRVQMVKNLSRICGISASRSLARRALYDASSEVRDAATNALALRPPEQYRDLLIKGLRYPWVPTSQHAAEALVAVNDQGAIEQLVVLLDEPNPTAPHKDEEGKWVVKELACVNHLRSCAMCHAPSPDRSDPVRGVIPTPGKPLPQAYYNSSHGQFVRADVTYLKQDFSVPLEVPNAHPWPNKQRFDFFVRTREVDEHEKSLGLPHAESYPQRDAVLFALRKLTGKNVGNSSDAWRRLIRRDG